MRQMYLILHSIVENKMCLGRPAATDRTTESPQATFHLTPLVGGIEVRGARFEVRGKPRANQGAAFWFSLKKFNAT